MHMWGITLKEIMEGIFRSLSTHILWLHFHSILKSGQRYKISRLFRLSFCFEQTEMSNPTNGLKNLLCCWIRHRSPGNNVFYLEALGTTFVFSLATAPTLTIVTLLSTFHLARSLFLPIVSVISSLYDEGIKISWYLDSDGEQDFVSDWRTLWLFQGKRTAVWIMILYFLRSRQVFWTVYWLKIWLMINMVATDDYKTTTQHMPILEIFQNNYNNNNIKNLLSVNVHEMIKLVCFTSSKLKQILKVVNL